MLITELNLEALNNALDEYMKSSYFHFYDGKKSIIEAIEEDRVFFNEDGTIFGEYRICSQCGAVMISGYIINDGLEYYCSDECLHQNMTHETYLEMYDNDEAFYTSWY